MISKIKTLLGLPVVHEEPKEIKEKVIEFGSIKDCPICKMNEGNKKRYEDKEKEELSKFKEYTSSSFEVQMGTKEVGFYSSEYNFYCIDKNQLDWFVYSKIPDSYNYIMCRCDMVFK